MAQMLQFLRDCGDPVSTVLCEHARRFDSVTPCPDNLKGRLGQCYGNASKLALADANLAYCEGFGFDPSMGVPIRHGWVVDPGGRVIDPTWRDNSDCIYFGIALRTSFMWRRVVARRQWCAWIDSHDWIGGVSLKELSEMLDPRWHSIDHLVKV